MSVAMSEGGFPGSPALGLDAGSEQRLVRLLCARLSLTVVSFGIAIGLDALGQALQSSARQGLYLTVAGAFAATVLSAVVLGHVRSEKRFADVQIAIDVAIVTALVHFSGGRESVFTFLYVVVTLYGAILFERRGAMVAATLCALAYGGILFGVELLGAASGDPEAKRLSLAVFVAVWGVHVGALYLVGVLASVLSVELHRTGQALDRSTHDLQRLLNLHQRTVESIMSGLLTTNTEGAITSFNPEAERITGLTAAEALGQDVEDVIEGARALVMARSAPSRALPSSRTRLRYRNRREEDLHLGLASSILRDANGEPLGHVVIFQDVTDVVAMESELRQSERLAAVGEMAAKIAHEIRNPLASMSGSIQILRGALDTDGDDAAGGESRRLMDIVLRETDRLNALITDFLQYSRPSRPNLEQVDLAPLVDEVVELAESGCPDHVEIVLENRRGLRVLADEDQLKQVLWNLLANAMEAMSEPGRLRVRVDLASGDASQGRGASGRKREQAGPAVEAPCVPMVEITIADSGSGIPRDVQDRIFEPFFTTKTGGTGLGLASVHRIVESHGGTISLESEPGKGTTFRLRLVRAGDAS